MSDSDNHNPLRANAIRGVKWVALKNWGGQALSLIVLLVMARLLSPADFGLYSIGTAIIIMLAAVTDQGLALALVQRAELKEAHYHTVFWAVAGVGSVLAMGLVVLRDTLAGLFGGSAQLAQILPALGLMLPLSAATGVVNASLIRQLDFRTGAIASTVSALAGGVLAVAMALNGYGVWSLVGQGVAGSLVGLILFIVLSGFRPRLVFSSMRLGEIWRFGILAMAGDLIAQLNQRAIVLLIGGFLGPQAVGLFSVGRRVVEMAQQTITGTIGEVATPAFAQMQFDKPRMKVVYLNSLQTLAAIIFPVFGLFAVFSADLTQLFLGTQWGEGAPVLMFLALGGMIESLFWLGGTALLAFGRSGLRMCLSLLNLTLTVAVFLLNWRSGITAVAAALVAKSVLMIPANIWLVSRVLPVTIGDYVRSIGPIVLAFTASIGMAIVLKSVLVRHAPYLALVLVSGGAFCLFYLTVISICFPELVARLALYGKSIRR